MPNHCLRSLSTEPGRIKEPAASPVRASTRLHRRLTHRLIQQADAGAPATETTGRGTGVDDAGLAEKVRVVQGAVDRAHKARPPPADLSRRALPRPGADAAEAEDEAAARVPREFAEAMLEEVGGLELAAIAGAIVAARDVRLHW